MNKHATKFMVGGVILLAIVLSYFLLVPSPKGKHADDSKQVQTVKVTASVEFPK